MSGFARSASTASASFASGASGPPSVRVLPTGALQRHALAAREQRDERADEDLRGLA